MTEPLTIRVSSVEEDLAEIERYDWTVTAVDVKGRELPRQRVPTPPFFNVTREWPNTTGDWWGIRIYQDNTFAGDGKFPGRQRYLRTVRGTLHVYGISCTLSIEGPR